MDFTEQESDFKHRDTLCYVISDARILLIEKKRGPRPDHLSEADEFLNGPGGGIEKGETPEECAVREVREETGIKPVNPEKIGVMRYYRDGEPERFIHIYRGSDYDGQPESSDEAEPVWKDIEELSYRKMWPSDSYWMPEMIDGNRFIANVVYRNGDFIQEDSELTTISREDKWNI